MVIKQFNSRQKAGAAQQAIKIATIGWTIIKPNAMRLKERYNAIINHNINVPK